MVKVKSKKMGARVARPQPLADQINHDEFAKPSGRIKIRTERKEADDKYVDGTLGRTIMKQSLAQLKEIEKEDYPEEEEEEEDTEWPALGAPVKRNKKEANVFISKAGFKKSFTKRQDSDEEDNANSDDDEIINEKEKAIPMSVDKLIKDFENELGLEAEDIEVLKHFGNLNADPQRKLADLFRDKITEKQTEIQTEVAAESVHEVNLSPEVQEMCKEVGKILSRYRSGPLPKMFKVFPKMRCWEELIYMTGPEKWSAASMYQATRIFVSNLKASMAQRFFNLVLLPRIRDDIGEYKRLNYHLYQALCKALFKAPAFFKGLVLPLCAAGNCTLREAIIIGSAIAKNHIPIDHSAAAIKKIASMEYTGANSIFLRIFFDKKYALPYQVIDECYDHFKRFESDERTLPVLWHQSLLTFIQRYKNDLSYEQKSELNKVVRFHTHHKITAEIRRELSNSTCREKEEPMIVDGN